MENCGIYKIINKINGKYYVGSSKHISTRWNCHKNLLNNSLHYNDFLQRSWNKYGNENFEFIVIKNCNESDLLLEEQMYLNECKINPKLSYNQIYSAGGGGDFSIETIKKMKKSRNNFKGENNPRFGIPLPNETREKISMANKRNYSIKENCPMYNKRHTDETKQKMSKIRIEKELKGKKNHMFGKHHTIATKLKISDALKGRKLTDNHKKKISETSKGRTPMLGKTHTEKTKKRMSESRKGKLIGIKNPMYGKHHTDSAKLAMSLKRRGISLDSTLITLKNRKTNEIITNTKLYFHTEKNLVYSHICKLLRGELKSHNDWVLPS